jgi:AraC-like DNA-binding protein
MSLAAFCRRSICSAEVSFNPQFGPVAYRAHQWLMQERALKAKNLLEHSDRTLSEISALCG